MEDGFCHKYDSLLPREIAKLSSSFALFSPPNDITEKNVPFCQFCSHLYSSLVVLTNVSSPAQRDENTLLIHPSAQSAVDVLTASVLLRGSSDGFSEA